MDINEMFQQILKGQVEIRDRLKNIENRLDKIEVRLDRIEKTQNDESMVLYGKIRRIEKVFNVDLLEKL